MAALPGRGLRKCGTKGASAGLGAWVRMRGHNCLPNLRLAQLRVDERTMHFPTNLPTPQALIHTRSGVTYLPAHQGTNAHLRLAQLRAISSP